MKTKRKTALKKRVWKKMGENKTRTTYARSGKVGTGGVVSMQRYPSGKGFAWGVYCRGKSEYCKTKGEAVKKVKAYMRKHK